MKQAIITIWALVIIGSGCRKNLPTAEVTNPVDGSVVSGTVLVTVAASDQEGVGSVVIYIDDSVRTATFSESLQVYFCQWNTIMYPESTEHAVFAEAYDRDNNYAVSDTVRVLAANHKIPPVVSINYPLDGEVVGGTVDILAGVTDNIGVLQVDFFVDDSLVYATGGQPYVHPWNTLVYPDSTQHSIYVSALDTDSNTAVSKTISVMVDNSGLPQ